VSRLNVVLVANNMAPTPDWVVRQRERESVEFVEQARAGPDVAAVAGDADLI
jgi:hypothetical protein